MAKKPTKQQQIDSLHQQLASRDREILELHGAPIVSTLTSNTFSSVVPPMVFASFTTSLLRVDKNFTYITALYK